MLADRIRDAIWTAAQDAGFTEQAQKTREDVGVETPRNRSFGHYSTNFPFQLTKALKRAPLQIAEDLAAKLRDNDLFQTVEAVKPGFINFRVSAAALCEVINEVLAAGQDYGKTDMGGGRKVQVEYVSANPTGPLSIGHGRLAAYGDTVANLLQATGHNVQREFYVNDVGNQIQRIAPSQEKHIRNDKGEKVEFTEDDYKGTYISDSSATTTIEMIVGKPDIFGKYFENNEFDINNPVDEYRNVVLPLMRENSELYQEILRQFRDDPDAINKNTIEDYMNQQRVVLDKFDVNFDKWFQESNLYKQDKNSQTAVQNTLNSLREKGEFYEKDGALWFASSRHSDEKDRVVQKSDGSKTYLMSDIAYIENKLGVRGFDKAIYVWGADHHGYIERIKSAGAALGYDPEQLEILIVQLVSIQGERMSKRRGNIIYLDELLEEVGPEPARFFFIMRSRDTHLDFDLDLARDKSEANPLYYLQYAHARICTMMGKAAEAGLSADPAHVDRLGNDAELDLLKRLADFPWELQGAAHAREPLRVIDYLRGLAQDFHAFYHDNRVIQPEEPELSAARLALCDALRTVFAGGLRVLGLSAPEKM